MRRKVREEGQKEKRRKEIKGRINRTEKRHSKCNQKFSVAGSGEYEQFFIHVYFI